MNKKREQKVKLLKKYLQQYDFVVTFTCYINLSVRYCVS